MGGADLPEPVPLGPERKGGAGEGTMGWMLGRVSTEGQNLL